MGLDPNYVANFGTSHYGHHVYDYLNDAILQDAIFFSVEHNDVGAIEYLIQQGKLDLSIVNDDGQNALHTAIALDRQEIATLILNSSHPSVSGAINQADRLGYTPLMLAVERGNLPLSKQLITLRASLCEGQNAYCDTDRLARKRDTLIAARLLMQTGGDIRDALLRSIQENIPSLEKCFAAKHDALRIACERGDIATAKELISSGVEASFVLARMLDDSPGLSATRARTVQSLISADVNIPWAFTYALAMQRESAVRSLLLLDSPGTRSYFPLVEYQPGTRERVVLWDRQKQPQGDLELCCAMNEGMTSAVGLLVKSGVKVENTLIQVAKLANVQNAQMLLATKPDITQVFLSLAKMGRHDAIKFLIGAGADPRVALLRLLDDQNVDAAKVLIDAGAKTADLLSSLALGSFGPKPPEELGLKPVVNYIRGHRQLATLIAAGADPSRAVYETLTSKPKNLTAAKNLIYAGANAQDADSVARYARQSSVRKQLKQSLKQVTDQIAIVRGQLERRVGPYATTGFPVIVAQAYLADPSSAKPIAALRAARITMEKNPEPTLAKYGSLHPDVAKITALLLALEKMDWQQIYSLVDNSPIEAEIALETVVALHNFPLAGVLWGVGAEPRQAVLHCIEKQSPEGLSLLRHAGYEDTTLLLLLIWKKDFALAKAFMAREGLSAYPVLEASLEEPDERLAVKHYIPAVTDGQSELIRAISDGNSQLEQALLDAGVSLEKTLLLAMQNAEPDMAIKLIAKGADTSVALVEALSNGHTDVAQMLLSLGADPVRARQHAQQTGAAQAHIMLVALINN